MTEVVTVIDIWNEDNEGNPYLVKEDVQIKRLVDIDQCFPEQLFNEKAKIFKDRCRVFDNIRKDFITVKMSYPAFKRLLEQQRIAGFKVEKK